MLKTLARAGAVLDLFTREQPELGVTEIARRLGMPKSNAHALVHSLCKIGLLRRTPGNRYALGWKIFVLSQRLLQSTELRTEVLPVMQALVDRFGETVHLAALQEGHVVYVEKLEGTRAVRISVSAVGGELPPHSSGVGKVLLAYLPREQVRAIVDRQGLPPFTRRTITRWEDLERELAAVREQGYAYDLEETLPELCCVAAPVRDHTGHVIAAMSISAPAHRFRRYRDTYTQAILQAAAFAPASATSTARRYMTRPRCPSAAWAPAGMVALAARPPSPSSRSCAGSRSRCSHSSTLWGETASPAASRPRREPPVGAGCGRCKCGNCNCRNCNGGKGKWQKQRGSRLATPFP